MKTLLRAATPLVVIALLLGLSATPSSGQDPADFDFSVSYACDDDLSVLVTLTLVNNGDTGVEITGAHLEPSYEQVSFDPTNVPVGGSAETTYDSDQNPLSEQGEIDILLLIGDQEGRLDYDLDLQYECQAQPTTTTTTTTAAPAVAAQPAAAEPTFTG